MIKDLITLPAEVWVTSQLFKETIIEKVILIEACYDRLGYKKLTYQTKGGSVYIWDRQYPDVEIFETKQEAINSVVDGNYSILNE